jgi:hypothetical protein
MWIGMLGVSIYGMGINGSILLMSLAWHGHLGGTGKLLACSSKEFDYSLHQSKIPLDPSGNRGHVLAFILYADKSKLSSFGTAKGYPIIARYGSLHSKVRNGTGVGGGQIVGWLPIIISDLLTLFKLACLTTIGR